MSYFCRKLRRSNAGYSRTKSNHGPSHESNHESDRVESWVEQCRIMGRTRSNHGSNEYVQIMGRTGSNHLLNGVNHESNSVES